MSSAPAFGTAAPPPDAPFRRGLALHESGDLNGAIEAFAAALQRNASDLDALVALGHCLLDAGQDTAGLLAPAFSRHPEDVRLLILQGRALLTAGRVQPAIGVLSLAAAVQPGNAAVQSGLANALAAAGAVERAIRHAMVAFQLAPDAAHASNFSSLLITGGYFREARNVAEYAVRRQPSHFGALVNWATALDALGLLDDAVAAGERAVAAAPGKAIGRLMLAGLYLRLGRMTPWAWDLYEWRHRQTTGQPAWAVGPVWKGEDPAGRTILLHAEQGYGDTLQFVRYAPMVAARGARVVLAVQPALLRLLQDVPGVALTVPIGGALPAFDMICPLLSLPRLFATTLDTIPPPLPYAGLGQAAPAAGILRVGLVWAGNPDFPQDALRSLPVSALAALAGIPGVQFHSLQMRPAPLPPGLDVIDLMAGVQDFADTAARVAGLDLVIAADTAVAHLAATMGHPVWLLSRFRGCWRWLHDRADSPWYPALRILRQTRTGDWAGVVAQLRQDLIALAASGHQA